MPFLVQLKLLVRFSIIDHDIFRTACEVGVEDCVIVVLLIHECKYLLSEHGQRKIDKRAGPIWITAGLKSLPVLLPSTWSSSINLGWGIKNKANTFSCILSPGYATSSQWGTALEKSKLKLNPSKKKKVQLTLFQFQVWLWMVIVTMLNQVHDSRIL